MAPEFDSVDFLNSALFDTRGDEIVLPANVAKFIADEVRSIIRLTGVIFNYAADLATFDPAGDLFADYVLSRRDANGIVFEIKTMRERYTGETGEAA